MSIGRALAEEDFEHPDIPGPPESRPGESLRKYNRRLRRHEEKLKLYVTLYAKMQKANADAYIDMAAAIRSAALNGDWRAALKFLERRDPHNWNRKQILRNLTTRETHHQHQDSVMAPDMFDLLRLLKHSERAFSKGLEDDCNGADSQPKAE